MSKNNCCSSRSNRSEKDQRKIMVSRRFLQMPSELQELIQRKSENLENLNSMACRMTSQISGAPSHSGDPHAREAIFAKKFGSGKGDRRVQGETGSSESGGNHGDSVPG